MVNITPLGLVIIATISGVILKFRLHSFSTCFYIFYAKSKKKKKHSIAQNKKKKNDEDQTLKKMLILPKEVSTFYTAFHEFYSQYNWFLLSTKKIIID